MISAIEGVYVLGSGCTGASEAFAVMGVGYAMVIATAAYVHVRLPRLCRSHGGGIPLSCAHRYVIGLSRCIIIIRCLCVISSAQRLPHTKQPTAEPALAPEVPHTVSDLSLHPALLVEHTV
jgi:hypothetical protein